MDDIDTLPAKKPWAKRIIIALGILFALVVVVYFVATSSSFVKGVILPKVGSAMNAKITAGEVSVSPFSRLYVKQLKVETTGSEPLMTAEELTLRYSLMDILKGFINVDEITVASPVINIVQEADGSSNLDPLMKGESSGKSKDDSAKETKVSIKNVLLKNGTIRQVQRNKDGSSQRTELTGLLVDLNQLGNGQIGRLKIGSSFSMEQNQAGTNSTMAGEFSGGYDIALNQQLMPETVKGSVKLSVARAQGNYKDLNGFSASLDADLNPQEIRQVALVFAQGNNQLGQLRLSGPFDVSRKEGTLKLEINSIDKNILALATAGQGYDFGGTTVNSTNQITVSQGGTFFAANGSVAGRDMSLTQGTTKTPEMNVNLDYQVSVNSGEKTAVLQRLDLSGIYNGKEFLRSELDRQMNLSWGQTVKGFRDASLNVVLTNFNLAEWGAVIGTNVTAGTANAVISLVSQQDGRTLKTDLAARIDGVSARFDSNRIEKATVVLETKANVEQMNIVNVTSYSLLLQQNGADVVKATGTARYLMDSKDTTAQLTLQGVLPSLLSIAAMPEANAQKGALNVTTQYSDNGTRKSAVGKLSVADFTGTYSTYAFTNFNLGFEFNFDMDPREMGINRAAISFGEGFNRGGTVDLKGRYNLENKSGQFTFNTVDLNQNAFGPILAPSLGENKLVSISLNASGEAKLNATGESSLKAEVKVANWVVQDAAGTLPKTPLAVEMKIDGGMKSEVLELRQFLVQLTPTPRAKNALNLQAKLDLSKTNPVPSTISLKSESFDVTPYYDMFAGPTQTNGAAATSPTSPASAQAPSTTGAEQPREPEAMELPFQQLTADLKIDRLYLREVAITNWVGKIAIRSNVIRIDPFDMEINGGAFNMSGTIDVGRPGYGYDLGLKASSVPLAPLANSFGSQTNTIEGVFVADARIRGAGVTGPNLRQNLGGNANFTLTNLNYQIVGPKLRRVLVPISIALRVPELLETPINWVSIQNEIGKGVVNLKHLGVESEAFYAESTGTINLENVISNSTLNLPLDLSLRRSLAEKTGLIAANTPTEAKYAKLPRFVTVKGTLGAPETDINKLAVAGMLARGAAAFGLGNDKTEKALGSLGSLLTGQRGGTNAASTNATSVGNIVQGLLGNKAGGTNAPAATNDTGASIVRGLSGLLGGKDAAATNNPAANAPATNAVQNALDSLFRPRSNKK